MYLGVQVNQQECDHPCPGNANQLCGGPRINAVYHTVVPVLTEDVSSAIAIEYPMGLGVHSLATQKYCHFTTETHPFLAYDAVDYARIRAKGKF